MYNTYREKDIQEALILLSAYTNNIRFRQEISVSNILNTFNNRGELIRSRRFDLMQELPNLIRVFELKIGTISIDIISNTLGTKGYYTLLQHHYPNHDIELVFSSPNGINQDALRLISTMPHIYYISTKDLGNIILNQYIKEINNKVPSANFMIKRIKEEFTILDL